MSIGVRLCLAGVLVAWLLPSNAWSNPPPRRAAATTPFEVSNECLRGAGKLLVHVAIPITYKPPYDIISGRYLYQLVCQLESRKCEAIELKLKGVDRGGKLGPWDLDRHPHVELAESAGNTYVINGPDQKSFTVDLDRGTVSLLESTASIRNAGKGFARCETQDFQQCTRDAECSKGHRCSSEEGKCQKSTR